MSKEDNLELYKTFFNKNKEKVIKDDSINLSNENYNKIKIDFEKSNFKMISYIS